MIDILLATYNSEKFIAEQIDSILNQTYSDFNIIISDDGSTDNTLQIITDYLKKYPIKISLLPFEKNRGAMMNFDYLLQNSKAEYISFADHDDIWHKDKLKLSIEELQTTEGKNKLPCLIFTDKSIVDENLNLIEKSSSVAEKFLPEKINLNRLLVQNIASGCTIMINKSLKDIIKSIPDEATMHDHYIAILAMIFGNVKFINLPLLLYRQHEKNELGASRYNLKYILKKIFTKRGEISKKFMKNINQVNKILEAYNNDISKDNKIVLTRFSELKTANFFKFRYILIKNNFLKTGCLRKLGMLILLSNR